MNRTLVSLTLAALAVACGESPPPQTPEAAQQRSAELPAGKATFHDQAAAGQKLFAEHCASCHGAHGNDGKAPALVGIKTGALPEEPPKTAKYRKTQFKTVADVASFVTKSMPPNAPGSLTEEQYWAILAFDLRANGIDLGDKKLDAELAPTLAIPR